MTAATGGIHRALAILWSELLEGPAPEAAWILNPGDEGIMRSLDRLSAPEASFVAPDRRSSIAAHVDHLRYGLELLNRWSRGEDPFADADYSASWRRSLVSDHEWQALREALRNEARAWLESLRQPRPMTEPDLLTVASSVAHLAYHLGAIRQMNRALQGPPARD